MHAFLEDGLSNILFGYNGHIRVEWLGSSMVILFIVYSSDQLNSMTIYGSIMDILEVKNLYNDNLNGSECNEVANSLCVHMRGGGISCT